MGTPVDSPFSLLGLEPRYAIDTCAVRQRQARLLARLHPDRHEAGVSREAAASEASKVNEAVAILTDPVRRAQALIDIIEPGVPSPALDQATLMELLERREWALGAKPTEVTQWAADEAEAATSAIATALDSAQRDLPMARRRLAYLRAVQRLRDEAGTRHGMPPSEAP